MKNFIFAIIYLFTSVTWADFATTKRVVQADAIQGTKAQENYIKDSPPKAANTKGWKCYADVAGVVPVDGTGGSPTVTFTSSATTPLKNSGGGFIFTHLASNQQGMGCSYDFVIDPDDKAKMMDVNLSYILRSGTFTAGGVSTDSDVEIYIYDITNAVIVSSLSSNKLLSNSTAISDLFSATFQSAWNSTSYRLILHTATTAANAFTLGFGDISVARSKYTYGTPITDWVTYTAGCTGAWSTNTTYLCKKRRVGDQYEYDVLISTSGAPNAATAIINIPDTIDTTKLTTTQTYHSIKDVTAALSDSGQTYLASVGYYTANQVVIVTPVASPVGAWQLVSNAAPFAFGAGDNIHAVFSLPIVGQSSSVQMSSDAPAGPVVASYSTLSSTTITSGTALKYTTIQKDTTGSYNVSTGASSIATPGQYKISVGGSYATTPVDLKLFVNGIDKGLFGTIGQGRYASTLEYPLNSGDLVTIVPNGSTTAADTNGWFSISKIVGGNSVARTEDTNLRYTTTSGQSLPTGVTVLQYNTKDYDTGGLFTSNTTFTAKDPGKYYVRCRIGLIAPTTGLSNAQLNIRKNTTAISVNYTTNSYTATAIYDMSVQDVIQLNSGETADCTFSNNFGTGTNVSTVSGTNNINIYRIGN